MSYHQLGAIIFFSCAVLFFCFNHTQVTISISRFFKLVDCKQSFDDDVAPFRNSLNRFTIDISAGGNTAADTSRIPRNDSLRVVLVPHTFEGQASRFNHTHLRGGFLDEDQRAHVNMQQVEVGVAAQFQNPLGSSSRALAEIELIKDTKIIRVPYLPYYTLEVYNFDKFHDMLDLSELNVLLSDNIPVLTDEEGVEEAVIGTQTIRFMDSDGGIMTQLKFRSDHILLGPTSKKLSSRHEYYKLLVAVVASSVLSLALAYFAYLVLSAGAKTGQKLPETTICASPLGTEPEEALNVSNAVPVTLMNVDGNLVVHNTVSVTPVTTELIVSPFAEISKRIFEMLNRGINVFDVSMGEPTNRPPTEVTDALASGAHNGFTRYTSVEGWVQLREAICRDFFTRKGISCTIDQIVVSHGAKQAMAQAILAVVKPGTKVIIPTPHWPVFLDMVRMAGAEPVSALTFREDGYNLRPEILKELLDTHQVSCLLLCNPNNPCGSVPSREQLMSLVNILKHYPDVVVISDEVYDRVIFDGVKHTSFASLEGMEPRTITVTGPSKAFSMTGLHIGFSVSPPEIASRIATVQASITNCASAVVQNATLATYSDGATRWLEENVKELQRKRNLCVDLLKEEPSLPLQFNVPQGTYYMFIDVSAYFGGIYTNPLGDSVVVNDSATMSFELLNAYQVAVVPGVAFGMDDHIRLHFAVSEDVLREVIVRLKKFLIALKPEFICQV